MSSISCAVVTKPIAPAMMKDDLSRSSSRHETRSRAMMKATQPAVRSVSSGDSSSVHGSSKRAARTKVRPQSAVVAAAPASQ
jgi:hypothetical protein